MRRKRVKAVLKLENDCWGWSMRRLCGFGLPVLMAWMVLSSPRPVAAQDLVREALASFPASTLRIEYSHPAALRALPNYATLRQRYEGPKLQELEDSLSNLGIRESDVEELVLGWTQSGDVWTFYGLAKGRFSASALSARAAEQGLAPVEIGDATAFCPGADTEANCLMLVGDSLGIFGSHQSLSAILAARGGESPALSSDTSFVKLVNEAGTSGSIRGVARGPAVADWFRGWIPNQTDLKLDWSEAFKPVNSLSYNVDTGDTVQLKVRMVCSSSESASSLRQVLEGLKLFQQLSWQNQSPNSPNPYKNLEIQSSGNQVLIRLDTPYSALQVG
jgi:hypothetical protein